MTCRIAATLDLPTPAAFVHHDLDFSQPTPMGFAFCKACGGHFTLEQWAAWRCEAGHVETRFVPRLLAGEVPCALCRAPIYIEPMHRAEVEMFGTVCDACVLKAAA